MTKKKTELDPIDINIVDLVSRGLSNPMIAKQVHLSRHAVSHRVTRACALLNAVNRPHLVRRFIEEGYSTIGEGIDQGSSTERDGAETSQATEGIQPR